jgi:hypothetical protein
MRMKLKAIWHILTSKSWYVAASKTGRPDSKMYNFGTYTQAMGETIMHCIHADMTITREMDQALDLAKNILTKAQ